ncbi:MAG: amino acid racemase [Muribaculaceae bacterium]|nr:amino acid racemase [Muribaculaceae bacterium]
MKKIGLIGGMGPESTIPYYKGIVHGVQQKVGKPYFPNMTIESVDLFHVVELCRDRKYDELCEYFLDAIDNLVKAGADIVALTANTSHIVFDEVLKKSPVPLISIVEATCREAKRRGYKNLGLIGTIFTMTEDFFKSAFLRNDIDIVVPTEVEMAYINSKIYDELEYGITREATVQKFVEIVGRMKADDGIDAIILGCTELPLILSDANSPVPCLDTMQIHIKELIEEMLSE